MTQDYPRYLLWISPTERMTCNTLAEALLAKGEHGGVIFEPLGMTACEKIAAEPTVNPENRKPVAGLDFDHRIEERKERCQTCKFWDTHGVAVAEIGICRKNAPVAQKASMKDCEDGTGYSRIPLWPETVDDDWCGEWQPLASAGRDG
jgi:hypothetical protein